MSIFEQFSSTEIIIHYEQLTKLLMIQKSSSADENNPSVNDKIHRLMLPYQGDKKSNILKSMKRYVRKLLLVHKKLEITFTVSNLVHVLQ